MKLSREELKAVTCLAMAMVAADEKLEEIEKFILFSQVLVEVGDVEKVEEILEESKDLELTTAIDMVKKLSYTQKHYVAAYLGFLMASDGDIDKREMALWQLLSIVCELPTMSVDDAINFMTNR